MRGITHAARGMGRALGLSPSRVDVWLLETSEPALRDAELLKAYRSMLSADESAQLERFALERSKQEYLLTRALSATLGSIARIQHEPHAAKRLRSVSFQRMKWNC
eukprot:tig00020780_g13763.t1